MDDRQVNQQTSYRTTAQVLSDNAALFKTLPALSAQHQKLLDSISLSDSLAVLQTIDTKGITKAKQEFLRQMMDYALMVGGAVISYASDTNNVALKARVNALPTKFQKARDDKKDGVAQTVHDAAEENLAGLADSGITDATLTALTTRIDAYRLSISSPSVARSTRRSKTELLAEEMKRAGMICKERLDGLMLQFKESQPDFYKTYRAARDIIDTGHRKKTPATPPSAPRSQILRRGRLGASEIERARSDHSVAGNGGTHQPTPSPS